MDFKDEISRSVENISIDYLLDLKCVARGIAPYIAQNRSRNEHANKNAKLVPQAQKYDTY